MMKTAARTRTSPGRWGLFALFLMVLPLRPNVVGVGPLLPEIQASFAASYQVVGLVMTIPLVCMGLFALPAASLGRRFGVGNTLTACILLLGTFGVLRAVAQSAEQLLALTLPLGVAMGLAGPLMAMLVKEQHVNRLAFGTGVYSTALQVGSSGSVALAVPLSLWLGGWRPALVVFSGIALLSAVARVLMPASRAPRPSGGSRPSPRIWRNARAWWLALVFWLAAFPFFGLVAWMTAAYVEAGWPAARAGVLTSVLAMIGMPFSMGVGWLSDRIGSRRTYLVLASAGLVVGTVGLAAFPDGAWAWTVITGAALGSLLPLSLTLPLDVAEDPARAGGLATVMLSVGYLMTALTPALLGGIRDLTGTFTASLWTVALAAMVLLVVSVASGRMVRPAGGDASCDGLDPSAIAGRPA